LKYQDKVGNNRYLAREGGVMKHFSMQNMERMGLFHIDGVKGKYIVPVPELYRYCEIAREILTGEYGVGLAKESFLKDIIQ